jgi:hypothetical protein
MPSTPQTYTISDFIEWHSKEQLRLDPDFQRGSVWTASAKVFLIDTILNDLPMPQVYFRTRINPATQSILREVVDGQQRLRAILEFASGKLRLTSKAPRFKGKTYGELSPQDQEQFLAYKVSAVQLINASDADVLEVFARLNSYSVKVTPAELRHAEYNEPVKWAIYDASLAWATLWNKYKIVSTRDAVRLKNNSLIAELFMALDQGLQDGGEPKITAYYRRQKSQPEEHFTPLDTCVGEIVEELGEQFLDTPFFDAPNFTILFCAVAFLKGWMPESRITDQVQSKYGRGVNWTKAKEVLSDISVTFDEEDIEGAQYASFVSATKSSTHRLSSRKPRFETLVRALSS